MYVFFAVCGSVVMTTNYEQVSKDGPCSNENIVVACSVVGSFLRWNITSTSLVISGSNTVTMFANPDDEGKETFISTSALNIDFYQNRTVRDPMNFSDSIIEAEMHFQLNASQFVTVSCTNSAQEANERHITPLRMFL